MIGTTTMKNVIYKAGYGWRGKVLSLLSTSFWVVFLVSHPDNFIKMWQGAGWIWRACMAFFLTTIVLMPLESFVSSTIFTDTSIEHRSMFGVKINKAYSDVVRLFRDTYFLKIQFEDGKKVKIWSSKGDLRVIISIIQKYSDKPIPVEAAV